MGGFLKRIKDMLLTDMLGGGVKSVQRGAFYSIASNQPNTAAVITIAAVNMSKSVLICNGRYDIGGNGNWQTAAGFLSSTTTVTLDVDRLNQYYFNAVIAWQVVEYY